MTDPAKPTDAMIEAGLRVDRDGADETERRAIIAAIYTAMRALEPADSDGDGDAEWLQSMAHEIRKCGDALNPDFSIALTDGLERIANGIVTRLEQHPGQGELVEAAYREGWDEGYATGDAGGRPSGWADDWAGSNSRAALARADAPV